MKGMNHEKALPPKYSLKIRKATVKNFPEDDSVILQKPV
jgi:hypothetical protein